tara:strand:- start:280 stop:444 length:165 start_codon:yes stop_codon:yes gene_type:complete
MARYRNRIDKLKIDIEELETKIVKAVSNNRPAMAKRLNMILKKQKVKLESWLRV